MFEDIVQDVGSIKKSVQSLLDVETCPSCRSTKVNPIDGVFIRAGLYIQVIQCVVCKEKWSVTYDADLNIIEVKIGV